MARLEGYEHGFGWDNFIFKGAYEGQMRRIRVAVGWGLLAPQITKVFVTHPNGHDILIHEWTNEGVMALDAIRRVDDSPVVIAPWLDAAVRGGDDVR